MELLTALESILLRAVPTFILVWILYFYVTRLFLKPLGQTLRKRHEATEGLRKAAEARVAMAEQKTASYHEALRADAAEIYKQQEQDRQRAMEHRTEILKQARQRAEERLAAARQQIRQDTEEAKKQLEQESEQMAQWILQAVLEPAGKNAPSPSGMAGAR